MRIIFYRNPAGEAVVLDWIHEQNAKVQAKIFRDLKQYRENKRGVEHERCKKGNKKRADAERGNV